MADRQKQALDRFSEIKLAWDLNDLPQNVDEFQAAVVSWLDSGDRTVPVRATQVLLLDPERPGAGRRRVVRAVHGALGPAWASAGANSLLLMQGLVLAAMPSPVPDDLRLVGLLGAGWEVMDVREAFRHSSAAWRGVAAGALWPDPIARFRQSVPLSDAVSIGSVSPDESHKKVGQEALQVMKSNESIAFTSNASRALQVLEVLFNTVMSGEDHQALAKGLSGVGQKLRQHTSQLHSAMPELLTVARPPELELLWWGQARYCHTLATPYRSLLKTPEGRTRAFYAAVREAADRAWRLDPEPAAAYLVEVLSGFGFPVDERRTLRDWLRELAANRGQDDAPQGILADLAAEDAAGLPVTWARLPGTQISDATDFDQALAIPVDAEIDLATWATWILRERVLEHRLKA